MATVIFGGYLVVNHVITRLTAERDRDRFLCQKCTRTFSRASEAGIVHETVEGINYTRVVCKWCKEKTAA